MRSRPFPSSHGALLLTAALLVGARPAHAALREVVLEGDRASVIAPDEDTPVRVDGGTLDFTLSPALDSAAVTASYRLTNPSTAAEGADVTFAFVRGARGDDEPLRVALEVDGAPLPFHAARAAELLAPRLRAWLDAHPAIGDELHAVVPSRLPALVEAAGGHCEDTCGHLVAWSRSAGAEDDDRLSQRLEDDALFGAAREVIPDTVAEVVGRWSALTRPSHGAELGFLRFHLDFGPGQTRAVTLRYDQRAEADRGAGPNTTYGFEHVRSPARRWAGFGPLDVSVQVPGRTRFASRLPFHGVARGGGPRPGGAPEGDRYQAGLPGLAEGDLRFQVMSLDGLWLGMIDPAGYRAVLAGIMAAAAALVGGAAARIEPGFTRARRFVFPLVAGLLAAVCAFAALVLLLAAFPEHALGFGWAGLVFGLRLVALSAPFGAAAGMLEATRLPRPR